MMEGFAEKSQRMVKRIQREEGQEKVRRRDKAKEEPAGETEAEGRKVMRQHRVAERCKLGRGGDVSLLPSPALIPLLFSLPSFKRRLGL